MFMTLAFDFAQMKLNYDSTNQWPNLCLESRHHIKGFDSQSSYANAPHLAVGWTEDKGYNYDLSSVPYRRPCLGHTSLIIQEISSAALSPHHERFCPTRDLCYIPTPDMRSTMGPALGHQLRFIVANCGIHDGVT